MSKESRICIARRFCVIARQNIENAKRSAEHIVQASLRHGLTVQEVSELTGLTPAEVEKYREKEDPNE